MRAPDPRAVVVARLSRTSHEVLRAFERAGLTPHPHLREMLDEHPSHRTERRGCGYTQATRFLSTFVNRPRGVDDAQDFDLLAEWPKRQTESLARQAIAAGWAQGWRHLERCDPATVANLLPASLAAALARLPQAIGEIEISLEHEESRLVTALIHRILCPEPPTAPTMPAMLLKPEIGSCSQAEEFFLEIAHHRIRRGGRVNVFVDEDDRPLLVEKIGLGESHSAMAVAPVAICDVTLPPGSLFALRYDEDAPYRREIGCGRALSLKIVREARFLRLTTLSVSPNVRRRAFSAQFEAQLRSDMLSPATTTIEHLRDFARERLARG